MTGEASTIDFIARDKDGGAVLILIDDQEWDGSAKRIAELQEKINAYAAYSIDGGLVRDHPDLAGKAVRLEVRCVHAPDPVAVHFLTAVKAVLLEHGLSLAVKQIRRQI